jgi:ribosome-binding factor A
MAAPRRVQRLQQLILEVAAEALQREVRDPRIGVVSITRVKLTPDLTQATIYWSALAEGAALRTTERGLETALPLIRRHVGHALKTRITPRLVLRRDDTLEKAQRLETIFQRLRAETDGDALPPLEGVTPPRPSEDEE